MIVSERRKTELSRVLYPLLLLCPLCIWAWLWKGAGWDASITLLIVYWAYFPILIAFERLLPFEPAWNANDGQLRNDLILSVLSVVVNSLATVVCLWVIVWTIKTFQPLVSLNVWPVHWPLLAQLIPGILLWDLGNHLSHRWAHKVPLLWRFHSVHHSAPRLCVVNTGRFHPVDVIKSVVVGAPIPVLLGVPAEVSLWYATFNVFIGLLTHANIRLQCGIFNTFLNTPNLHRWHHSPYREETDTNYGEATVVWDRLFGSYVFPSGQPRRNVGLGTAVPVSAKLIEALVHPFTLRGHRASIAHSIASLEAGEAGSAAPSNHVAYRAATIGRS